MNTVSRLLFVLIFIMIAFGWLMSDYRHVTETLNEVRRQLALRDEVIAELQRVITAVTAERDAFKRELDNLKGELARALAAIETLRQELDTLNIAHSETLEAKEAEIRRLHSVIFNLEEGIRAYEQAFQIANNRIAVLEAQMTLIDCSGLPKANPGETADTEFSNGVVGLTITGGLSLCVLLGLVFARRFRQPRSAFGKAHTRQATLRPLILRPQPHRRYHHRTG
jgi:uncharacterized protein involved in exopolysaccharide biosynthesis